MSIKRRDAFRAAAALLAPSAYAAGNSPQRPTRASEVWVRTELYFGTNRPNDPPVTEAEFSDFVDKYVTERFPDGLTLLSAYGQFRNSRGELVREISYLLILLYPREMQDAHARIQDIRRLYKEAHSQESVLRVDGFNFVSF